MVDPKMSPEEVSELAGAAEWLAVRTQQTVYSCVCVMLSEMAFVPGTWDNPQRLAETLGKWCAELPHGLTVPALVPSDLSRRPGMIWALTVRRSLPTRILLTEEPTDDDT